jgi:polyisoprenoid-binding protein YceI
MKKIVLTMATLLLLAAVFAFTVLQSWQITDKYSISFSSDDVGGIFKTFTGQIVFDEKNLAASKFDVTIDAASINTGNGLQNKHAKSDEWFDVVKYPVIKFTSSKIVQAGNAYQAIGDLQLHGKTKQITIPFTVQKNGSGLTFAGSFNVNRTDFNIGKPGGDVAEVIKVDLSVPVVKK